LLFVTVTTFANIRVQVYFSDQTTTLVKEALEKVEEVKSIMYDNVGKNFLTVRSRFLAPPIDKVFKRGEDLTTVEFMAKEVQSKGGMFKRGALTLKRKKWWQNLKWRVYFSLCCALLVVVLIYFGGAMVCGGWRWDKCTDWIFSEIFGV